MQIPSWISPALTGAAAGAAALAVIGFSFGGWVTAGTASASVREARTQVVAKFCVNKFAADPDAVAQFAKLKKTKSWERDQLIVEGGWASFPGIDGGILGVADACAKQLAKMDALPPMAQPVPTGADNS
ncbi:hypothetical protein [Oricola sp.]|uniref:hypothetical protein n=1 Tax=Oricola sp. TaxID=1979950 RepID=UPI0025E160F9|nr:hypothetical protein [Oricola sp.]MCI5075263.1 hypothetical protein [Oricola sp.]